VWFPQHRVSDADDLYRRLPRGDASHLPHDDVADLDDLVGRPSLLRLGYLFWERDRERERARTARDDESLEYRWGAYSGVYLAYRPSMALQLLLHGYIVVVAIVYSGGACEF